jgi:hypothetical protein
MRLSASSACRRRPLSGSWRYSVEACNYLLATQRGQHPGCAVTSMPLETVRGILRGSHLSRKREGAGSSCVVFWDSSGNVSSTSKETTNWETTSLSSAQRVIIRAINFEASISTSPADSFRHSSRLVRGEDVW